MLAAIVTPARKSLVAITHTADRLAVTGGNAIAAAMTTGALGGFTNLQDALNSLWRVPPRPTLGWWHFLRGRLFSLATVTATGFLLLVSRIASAVLSWMGAETAHRFHLPVLGLHLVNNAISFGVVTSLFALVFRLLPDTPVRMRHGWIGAAATALLFTTGKTLLGFYLGRASLTSAYGAAGALLVLLLWSDYVAQIVLFGAEFTRVAALSNGGRDFTPLSEPAETSRRD